MRGQRNGVGLQLLRTLDSPASSPTVFILELNAVVGDPGQRNAAGILTSSMKTLLKSNNLLHSVT